MRCAGRTPLHAAAFTDHVECLQLLLSHNAQVNSTDAAGKTSLMMAAENGQTNAVGTAALQTDTCIISVFVLLCKLARKAFQFADFILVSVLVQSCWLAALKRI